MARQKFVRTPGDNEILKRFANPAPVDIVKDIISSRSAIYRRIAQLVNAHLLIRVPGTKVRTRTKPKEVYCAVGSMSGIQGDPDSCGNAEPARGADDG